MVTSRGQYLLREAGTDIYENKRCEMYVEMPQVCRDDGGVIVFLFRDYVEATSNKIGNGKLSGNLEATDAVMLNAGGLSLKCYLSINYERPNALHSALIDFLGLFASLKI